MAASANPSANDENSRHGAAPPPSNNGNSAAETSGQPTPAGLRHNPGISTDWSADEQSMLDELLIKHASEPSIVRYAKIAMRLKDKTVRDVAFRCRWMTKKENGKRRKEDHSTTRRNKEKKQEKGTDTSARPTSHSARPSGPMYVPPMMPMDNEDGISFKAIGGVTGQLLEQNAQIFSQISANLSAFQLHENINLLCQTRDNIVSILNNSNDMPDIMKQMPPLTEKINEELANSILPRMTHHMKS